MQAVFGTLVSQGHKCYSSILAGADIVEARNQLATQFLESDFDVMIGIDDDVSVTVDVALKLINANVDYIGACIPPRQISLAQFADGIRKGLSDRDAQLRAAPLIDGAGLGNGITKVEQVGTGFFVLRRAIIERLAASDSVVKRTTHMPLSSVTTYGFYDPLIDKDGLRHPEDYSFSRRVRSAGYAIRAYKGPGVTHSGDMTFSS